MSSISEDFYEEILKPNKSHTNCIIQIVLCKTAFSIKMSYYWFNKHELLKKPKGKYHNNDGKEKAAKHYLDYKDVLKEKAKNVYINLSEEEKEVKSLSSQDRYNKLKEKSS